MTTKHPIVFLAGAPDADDLDWHGNNLAQGFDDVFVRILNGRREVATTQTWLTSTPTAASKWRVTRLDADDVMDVDPRDALPQTQFLSFDKHGADEEGQHSDFLEHSMAIFDDLVSSQILQQEPAPNGRGEDTIMDSTTSFATTNMTDFSSNSSQGSQTTIKPINHAPNHAPKVTIQGGISNLKQIPAADYISQILPQTITVNLIAGVVTVSPARTVRLRKRNTEMDIIELVVGDETRAGFTISFWLAPLESQNKATDDLRDTLRTLRAGDVVLLRNVALSCFRNCVYGQSLSKRFARNSSFITLMSDDTAPQLPVNLGAKLQRVQDWIFDFVGVDKKLASSMLSTQDGRAMHSDLPPDTQD